MTKPPISKKVLSDKLWSTVQSSDKTAIQKKVEQFMSGEDVLLDQHLFAFDIQASKVHAQGLQRIDILSHAELEQITVSLDDLLYQFKKGLFVLDQSFEDGHSAIEYFLTEQLGDLGKKIHTGRSRNDQVAVATRLYCKQALLDLKQINVQIAQVCLTQAEQHKDSIMPGYTHIQRAVVSSWGLWFASFAESFCDNSQLAQQTLDWIDANPLGTAAGYGVNLELDRDFTTEALGFARMQVNPMYVQNSRGKFELQVLMAFKQAMLDIRRLAWDLSLFTSAEFNLVKLPDLFSTGSSIMPNKRNPDTVELMRAHYAKLVGVYNEIESLLSLPSGYQRDLQNTKAPLINGITESLLCLALVPELLSGVDICHANCEKAIEPAMFATDKAIELAREGVPFRQAYQQLKDNYQDLAQRSPLQALRDRVSPGACANLKLSEMADRLENV
ncbi:argininosuccinate lyase [Kangiella koreensis]|uniref:Argininosuccinate lyase n=1 Tax=Kangiella koreensis (strain DSM 16069 / JCM 12317 / KCTC 12182 / SW-125) TaxID=523791 RepID=C7R8V5_KANKD|nr:argininosuccinate lyase [Kangiella koreensis]ACV25968.1 argininosuccinate lyase [Kangiella koreensis DSM 16069]